MNVMKNKIWRLVVGLQFLIAGICPAAVIEKDICVYGGTAAGVTAAVQAARLGKSVVLIEPGKHIGGMTSGGLGNTDVGKTETIGGIAREFYQQIHHWYQNPEHWKFQTSEEYWQKADKKRLASDAMFVFEPHVAERLLNQMLAKAGVSVVLGERLDLKGGVKKSGPQIVSIRMESGQVFAAKVFLDCSYEGDLMAKAGVSYTVGREANAQYGEKINGVQTSEPPRRGDKPLDPFVRPGDPASGVIVGLQPTVIGQEGDGDHRVQAYNYRLCLTQVPENRVAFDKPADYDEREFELLLRWIEVGGGKGLPAGTSPLPNAKTDSNKAGWVSTDYMGHADDYPDADHATREKIIHDHIRYIKGLLWTAAYHPRVPADVRRKAASWGYAKDEFGDTGHFPFQIYAREARRMLGELVMTEHEVRSARKVTDPVALGSYGMDSHPTQLWVKDGALHADTPPWTGVRPYGISYRALTPRVAQCSNLLVPVCLSASHSAYGSLRMEPVYMMLGQAAATAAALAVDGKLAVQDVPYPTLRAQLLKDGQRLEAASKPRAPAE